VLLHLIGIRSSISYLKDIGAKSLYISSFYKSDGVDGGMGVVDHKAIDKMLGSMSDFNTLLKELKKDSSMYICAVYHSYCNAVHLSLCLSIPLCRFCTVI